MGTLASQAEIDVWLQAPETFLRGSWVLYPDKCRDFICKILQSGAFFDRKMVRNAVHNAFLNTSTMGNAVPCVSSPFHEWERHPHASPLPRNDPCIISPYHIKILSEQTQKHCSHCTSIWGKWGDITCREMTVKKVSFKLITACTVVQAVV